MPIVKSVQDAYLKYTAKTAPDRAGARYDAAKNVALPRYLGGVNPFTVVREIVRNVLGRFGIPPAKSGAYYAFGFEITKASLAHRDQALKKVVAGLEAKYVTLGLDPTVLKEIEKTIGVA